MSDIVERLRNGADHEHGFGSLGAANLIDEAIAEIERLRAWKEKVIDQARRDEDSICQDLGRVLDFPWYKDDPANFPDATEADGVCVGEHVAATIAKTAADKIAALRAEIAAKDAEIARLREALIRARKDIADWAAYVSPLFRVKWGLDGDLAAIDAALAGSAADALKGET